ncbi:MAG: ABC-2 type transport system ATP-binding protein [Verrucomicrobiales bacterium]|jgi:ABC-2 type transport system ATP-binding protein
MIQVQDLNKSYGGKIAVDGISFEVKKGEIVGFLGPNGAGKSTTMRILTGYLAATSGFASIAGHDVFRDSIAARRQIGYMPENVPLYTDMRVKEYLQFRGKLKGLRGSDMRSRVGKVMETCGLTDVRRKMIGSLSKGYRQRVGLADALVHDPQLLILDEPTNGLDPNQIRSVRELIKSLGKQHTILLSTHILYEVEQTCDRVIIIDKGKIKASDSPKSLISQSRTAGLVTVEMKGPRDRLQNQLKSISGVKRIELANEDEEWVKFELRCAANADVRDAVYDLSLKNKWPLRELKSHSVTLEDVFAEVTGAAKN